MISKIQTLREKYPSQFWLLLWGMLISTIGSSMIWPFLTIYLRAKLNVPLSTVASILALNAVMGLAASFISGPIVDRAGRKWVMVISLAVNSIGFILMSQASTLWQFALLMALSGTFNPIYRVGADAMVADLIPDENRTEAYSLLRMSNNAGIAIGPSIGGFLAASSYTNTFFAAAISMGIYSLLVAFFARETLPRLSDQKGFHKSPLGSFSRILLDRRFLAFCAIFTLTYMSSSLLWQLMPVYAKENYHIAENLYGFIPTTNAIMVVTLQYLVTSFSKKHSPVKVVALGSLLYALGVGGVSLATGFWGFELCMIISTFGELLTVPTSTTFVAGLAPPDMRGRYMSIYTLTWSIASGIAPLIGGLLNDHIAPVTIWYGGFTFAFIAAIGFLFLSRSFTKKAVQA
jgi:MFS family permease